MTQADHDRLVAIVERHCREHNYTSIQREQKYQAMMRGYMVEGEVDVLARSPFGYYLFYEVKSCAKKYSKAKEQYERFCRTHPYLYVKGIFVCPSGVKRLE